MASGLADMLPVDWKGDPRFIGIIGVVAFLVLVSTFFMFRGKKGTSKKTLQKKAKKAEKGKDGGGKEKVSPSASAEATDVQAKSDMPEKLKKQKKVAATEEEKQAKKGRSRSEKTAKFGSIPAKDDRRREKGTHQQGSGCR